jgi:chromosome segregation ATPase
MVDKEEAVVRLKSEVVLL